MAATPAVLLVHPPVFDFTAFDLFLYPLGLLEAAAAFEAQGFSVRVVDALDRFHALPEQPGLKQATFRRDGCGQFARQRIEPPAAYRRIPRRFHRFGLPRASLKAAMALVPRPDLVGITCTMTYWYLGVREVVEISRELFDKTPVVLGGVYASLCPSHALAAAGVDRLAPASDGRSSRAPSHHLLASARDSAAVRASAGCPFLCTYCAARLLAGPWAPRPAAEVLAELSFLAGRQGRRHIAFHDDALLAGGGAFFREIAAGIVRRGLEKQARFHCVNGLNAAGLSRDIAAALRRAGFVTIRLGFETADEGLQSRTGGKTSGHDLAAAIENLRAEGFPAEELGVYVMAGLPGQEAESAAESCRFVHSLGAMVRITEYAPVPGTPAFEEARRLSRLDLDEPLNHSKCAAAYRFETLTPGELTELKSLAKQLNERLLARSPGSSML